MFLKMTLTLGLQNGRCDDCDETFGGFDLNQFSNCSSLPLAESFFQEELLTKICFTSSNSSASSSVFVEGRSPGIFGSAKDGSFF